MSRKLHRYEGGGVEVTWDAKRCIHAAECVARLPQVFDPSAKPWIRPGEAPPATVARVVARCPTGALQIRGGAPAEEPDAQTTVHVAADGPLYFRGRLEVRDAAGATLVEDTRAALCRCGASKDKPFCDGSHAGAGFRDPGGLPAERGRTDDAAGDRADGADGADAVPLAISAAKDGPLLLQGPWRFRSGDRTGDEVLGAVQVKGALCRCGASSTKPYCDGSHKKIDFKDG